MKRFFRVYYEDEEGKYYATDLNSDLQGYCSNPDEASLFTCEAGSESDVEEEWARIDHGVEWLPEDEQMRLNGAIPLPIEGVSSPAENDVMTIVERKV